MSDRPQVGQVLTTAALSADRASEVRRLLVAAFDGGFSDDDWEHALGGLHVLVVDNDVAVAHAAVVPRVIEVAGQAFRAGYVEAVATAPARHGEGLGALAMAEITDVVRRDYELGVLSTDRHAFYARLGWERWRGPTFVRDGDRTVRTEDEDDGVMILRCGPSAAIDLSAAISCEARSGDDW
jgi:aminoglycoside 2'-N-acetyltransferase I